MHMQCSSPLWLKNTIEGLRYTHNATACLQMFLESLCQNRFARIFTVDIGTTNIGESRSPQIPRWYSYECVNDGVYNEPECFCTS